jgi:predicted HTH transcriptional regulator
VSDGKYRDNCVRGTLVKLHNDETGKIEKCMGELDYHPHGMMVLLESGTKDRVLEILESANEEQKDEFPKESAIIEYKASFSIPTESNEEIMKRHKIPDEKALKARLPEIKNNLRKSVMKTIAAFGNTQGGILCIGIKDRTHEVLGLDLEYTEVEDGDGLITEIKNKMHVFFGDTYYEAISCTNLEIVENKNGKEYLKIQVRTALNPIIIKIDGLVKNQKVVIDQYFIRTSNGSEEIPAQNFFLSHWPERGKKINIKLS